MEKVFILAAHRTPIGAFQGTFSSIAAPQLGSFAIKKALEASGLSGTEITECIMGQVLTAGAGQAPARQAAIYAALPVNTQCLTINKVCGSGLKAVMLAADSLRLNGQQAIVAGGQENMSLAPHLLESSRNGYRMGNIAMADSMIKDGLWDPYNKFHMGNAAEFCAKEYHFSREEQDAFATQSYKKALKAQEAGYFQKEIVSVPVESKKETLMVNRDEEPGNVKFDKMPSLKPAFDKEGTVTAANASKINDGAAALVLTTETYLKSHHATTKPLARVVSYATFAQDPKWFTTAPVGAIKAALKLAALEMKDIGLWEINEAFSLVTMAAQKDLQIPFEKINVHGGAVALGHPLGASGARILTTLTHALHTHNQRFGLATLCIGGGEAVAMIIEKVN